MRFLFLLVFLTSTIFANPYSCTMGDYTYTGKTYSDSHITDKTEGHPSCLKRDNMDDETLGKNYKENRASIEVQIDKMLNDPGCEDSWEILNEYRSRLEKHWLTFNELTKKRIAWVENNKKNYDIQRAFAYMGAFSATCSGGQNRKTSFINLDLINKIPTSYGPTKIKKDGLVAQDCGEVVASGSDDLKSFKVSMKEAKGDDCKFLFDPYGIPDQVIVKNDSGNVLFDSGCKGEDSPPPFQSIPLASVKGGLIEINVINNCEDPQRKKGVSAWEMKLQCDKEPAPVCQKPKEELVRLLKLELGYTKSLIDANALHRACFFSLDEYLLNDLISDGLIKLEDKPLTNGMCETGDTACEEKYLKNRHSEKKSIPPVLPLRDPSSEQDQFRCPEQPDSEKENIFKRISRAYCQVGWGKLGLESTPNNLK